MIRELSIEDKQADFEDQYATLRKDPKKIVFCPWCSGINRAPQEGEEPAAACCPQFAMGVDLIGKKQLQSVIDQRKEILLGGRRNLKCPYCGELNFIDAIKSPADWKRPNVSPFCCDLLSDAALAIAQREVLEDRKRKLEQIGEAIDKAATN